MTLRVEQLEFRDVPAVILTETTTITTIFGQTADLTVTVDDTAAGVYRWNYHLANATVNYADPGNPEQGIGIFRIQTAPDSVVVSTLGSTSGWSVYVGDASENNGLVQWAAGEWGTQLPTGQSFDFWFETDPTEIVDSTATFADAGFAMPADGPAKAPGEKPEIKLNVDGMTDATKNVGTGKKIHINDNFDENQQNATAYYADWDKDPVTEEYQICAIDPDLVAGTLNLKSAAKNWVVNWTVDDRVKVWYQEWHQGADLGTWKLINPAVGIRGTNEAVPATIPLFFEGVAIKSRTVNQTFTIDAELVVNNGNGLVRTFDQAKATVYSGIGVRDNYFAEARSQLADATGWKLLAVDGAIWRAQAKKTVENWQVVARDVFAKIFEAPKTTLFQGVSVDKVIFDTFDESVPGLGRIDPLDYAKAFAIDERIAAAYLAHAWHEQYLKQVEGVSDFPTAHAQAILKELQIMGETGTRTDAPPITDGDSTTYRWSYESGLVVTVEWIKGTKTITKFVVTRPS